MRVPILDKHKLTHDDLVWFYSAAEQAFNRVEDIKRKQPAEVTGEVFTSMRRLASYSGSPAIKQLFRGSMKHFPWRLDARINDREREVIVAMFDQLKNRKLADQASSPDMRDLELILLAAQASVREAGRIASESKKVREGLDGIQDILDGKKD